MPTQLAHLMSTPYALHLWLLAAILITGIGALATELRRGEPRGRRLQIETVTGALALLSLWIMTTPLTGSLLSLPLIATLRLSHHLMGRHHARRTLS